MKMTSVTSDAACAEKPAVHGGSKKVEPPSGFILALFRMINGAPDEVISWTPDGDAFLIGADLNRLEGEVLPLYFRHNRFQSLVRQLNFYSFRKQNRERNVWIYKHDLFRRDHPEDLYLVRRRTCPGLDGRKQRFSRLSAKKLTRQESLETKSGDDENDENDDDSTIDESPVKPAASSLPTKKRQLLPTKAKRKDAAANAAWPSTTFIDTSMLHDEPMAVSEDSDDQASTVKLETKSEIEEQSVIVSEVASQLAKHFKKAMGGRKGVTARRAGVVTPPFSSSRSPTYSSGTLLTYDDEYVHDINAFETKQLSQPSTVKNTATELVTPADHSVIPFQSAEGVVERLLNCIGKEERSSILTGAKVALFCMIASPSTEKNFCSEMQHMLSSCEQLSADFKNYRIALSPSESNKLHQLSLQQTFEHEGSRCAFVHEFMIFAINSMQNLLTKVVASYASNDDLAILEHTMRSWQKCVAIAA